MKGYLFSEEYLSTEFFGVFRYLDSLTVVKISQKVVFVAHLGRKNTLYLDNKWTFSESL